MAMNENRDENMGRNSDELTPAEREEYERLPRERMPSRILEERTVRALRRRGLIAAGSSHLRWQRPWMVAAGIAAAIALFVSGMLVGQGMGARQTADVIATIYPDATQRAAARVQTRGSELAAALSQLAEAADSADSEEVELARQVALSAFWAAAEEVVRLAPNDPLAARILQELERQDEGEGTGAGERNVVWF